MNLYLVTAYNSNVYVVAKTWEEAADRAKSALQSHGYAFRYITAVELIASEQGMPELLAIEKSVDIAELVKMIPVYEE